MNSDELELLYRTRQSCREFSDRPLERELAERICRAALLAPSARNAQPWHIFLLMGEKAKEVLPAIQHLGANKFAGKAQAFAVIAEDASCGVMKVASAFKENEFVRNDLGILTAHLVLAAEAAGVGSCIIGWRNEDKLRALLSLPDKRRIPAVVALGYPADGYPVREKKRKDEAEVLTVLS